MEIAINIFHNLYESIMKDYALSKLGEHELYKAIQHGTPLPEHHGRLIDADAYIDKHGECGWLDDITVDEFNKITPTIIPATKEGDGEC